MGLRPSMLDDLGLGSRGAMAGAAVLQAHRHPRERRGRRHSRGPAGGASHLRVPVWSRRRLRIARGTPARRRIEVSVDGSRRAISGRRDGRRRRVRSRERCAAAGWACIGMQERVMELGGELILASQPEKGTGRFGEDSTEQEAGDRMAVRILLADDHGVVRKGLRFLLERQPGMEVVGEAADGREAVRWPKRRVRTSSSWMSRMPLLNGIEATRADRQARPEIGVIILSMHSDEDYLLSALNAGAKGYLLKDSADVGPGARHAGGQRGHAILQPRDREDLLRRLYAISAAAEIAGFLRASDGGGRRRCCNCWPREDRTRKSRRCWISASTPSTRTARI